MADESSPPDIPWIRLDTSRDMIDPAPRGSTPPAWRSSVTVFYHEPSAEDQPTPGKTVTLVKVSATITGYRQSHFFDIDIPIEWLDEDLWDTYKYLNPRARAPYHPCHGAILSVSVFPKTVEHDDVSEDAFPYIISVQPSNRELYEKGTEETEYASQSRSNVKVNKGVKTIEDSETKFDLTGKLKGGLGELSGGLNHKSGTKVESVDMITADHHRQQTESYSFSTSVEHIYSLLRTYHIGTNRVLFLLQPRPHIQDPPFTFVNGPRRLEGVQEFIILVERPSHVEGLCIEASLETAHLETKTVYEPRLIRATDLWINDNINKTAESLELEPWERDLEFETAVYGSEIWNATPHWPKGWKYGKHQEKAWNERDVEKVFEIKYWMESGGKGQLWSEENWEATRFAAARFADLAPFEDLEVIYERVTRLTGTLFIAGRRLSACFGDTIAADVSLASRPSLLFEQKLDSSAFQENFKPVDNTSSVTAANEIVEEIGDAIISSLDSPDRYPYGSIEVGQASFVIEPLRRYFARMPESDAHNSALEDIDGLGADVLAAIRERFDARRRRDVLQIEPDLLRTALDLDLADFRQLQVALVGQSRGRDIAGRHMEIPNVQGEPIGLALDLLEDRGLSVHSVDASSDLPRGTVLRQYPEPGYYPASLSRVVLIASSGPVRIPDLAGREAEEAIEQLVALGLRVSQIPHDAGEAALGRVLSAQPAAGEYVARGTEVRLIVGNVGRR